MSEVSTCLHVHLRHKSDLCGKILLKFKDFKPPCPHSVIHLEHKYINKKLFEEESKDIRFLISL